MLKMKSCPHCNRTYSDLSMSYCLSDGSVLSAPFDSDNYQIAVAHQTLPLFDEIETVVSAPKIPNEPSLDVSLEGEKIRIGEHFTISFKRTLRIPDDGKVYPLPPALGTFPICKVADYADRVPAAWNRHGGVFIPMYQREALWLDFGCSYWRANAVKIAAGKINAVTGKPWNQRIDKNDQDYVVCPEQKWLDGFKTGTGVVRQFVAMPLGAGYTVEEQLTGNDEFGGVQVIVFEPKKGRFPENEPPDSALRSIPAPMNSAIPADDTEMGLGAGGKIDQKIYPDKYGADTWDESTYGRLFVHIVNSRMYESITGNPAPTTLISAESYTEYGYPWFELYDEHLKDLQVGEELYTIKPIGLVDKIKGIFTKDEMLSIKDDQIQKIKTNSNQINDGDW